MSDGINPTNSKYIDNYDNLRFQDAAQTIFFKYQMMGTIKSSDGINTTTATAPVAPNRQHTTIRSQACIIL
jgi:hypothetical protein